MLFAVARITREELQRFLAELPDIRAENYCLPEFNDVLRATKLVRGRTVGFSLDLLSQILHRTRYLGESCAHESWRSTSIRRLWVSLLSFKLFLMKTLS